MPANEYAFQTTWLVPGTPEEITAILADAPDLARWWPSVYLEVREIDAGDERGIGQVVELYTKGFLPYTLRWRFEVTESDPPRGFRLEARGDFVGVGIWTLTPRRPSDDPAGPLTEVVYDWTVIAEKGVLKRFSRFIKPAFSANHHWAMRRGEESLRLELARRRSTDPVVLGAIPAPPGPTFPHNLRKR